MKRPILNEVFSPKLDKPLYHYTGLSGLFGIIKSREIWVTHTQYLNDRREFVHAVDLVREEIDRLLKSVTGDEARVVCLKAMRAAMEWTPETVNVCVCSFSEDHDSLSQWRAYSDEECGFAIGLPPEILIQAVEHQRWYLARCIYDADEQREIVRSLVEEILDENLSLVTADEIRAGEDEDRDILVKAGGNLRPYLNRYAPILKHKSFREEKEWRVISRPLSCTSESFSFREGCGLLVPYSRLPLHSEDVEFRLNRVVIGPAQDPIKSRSSLVSFLMQQRLLKGLEVDVEVSVVPYRAR